MYWQQVREQRNSFSSKLISGLPMATLFGAPILLFIAVVYLFFPEWYTKVSARVPGAISSIVVAVIIFIFCFAYLRMQYKWEMNEQLYQELIRKQNL